MLSHPIPYNKRFIHINISVYAQTWIAIDRLAIEPRHYIQKYITTIVFNPVNLYRFIFSHKKWSENKEKQCKIADTKYCVQLFWKVSFSGASILVCFDSRSKHTHHRVHSTLRPILSRPISIYLCSNLDFCPNHLKLCEVFVFCYGFV